MKLKAKKPEVLKIPSLVETAPIDRRNQKKTFNENDDDILIENVSTKEKKDRSKNKVNAAIHKVTEESDDENAPEVINAADASLEQLRQLHQIINIPKKKRKVSKKDADIDISKPIDIDDSIFAVTSDLNEEEDMAPPILAARKIIKPKTHKKIGDLEIAVLEDPKINILEAFPMSKNAIAVTEELFNRHKRVSLAIFSQQKKRAPSRRFIVNTATQK